MANNGKDMVAKKVITLQGRAEMLQGEQHLLVEQPLPNVSVITLNRPECKNLLTHRTRAQLFNQLQLNDQNPDIRVTVIRGSGNTFCSGNDFDTFRHEEVLPFFEADFDGQTSRHVLNGWFMMNDLAKPVVAMVEGEAIGGGLELAAACDVCICSEDAQFGYGQVRGQGLADYQILPWMCGMRNAMELLLTNGTMNGLEAVKRRFATQSAPTGELEAVTFDLAQRIAKIPSDLLAFNKKSVHRAFEAQGMRTNLRTAVDLETLMFKAAGAKMLTARRGPQRGVPQAERVPVPRVEQPASAERLPRPPPPMPAPAQVAFQAVSAKPLVEMASAGPPPPAALAKPALAKPALAKPVAAKPVQAKPAPTLTQSMFEDTEEGLEDIVGTSSKPTAASAPVPKPVAKPGAAAKPVAAKLIAAKPRVTPAAKPANVAGAKPPIAVAKPLAAAATKPLAAATTKPLAAAATKPLTAAAAKPLAAAATKPLTATAAKPQAKPPVGGKPVAAIQTGEEEEDEDEEAVHIHLHENVHFHFGKKSKL